MKYVVRYLLEGDGTVPVFVADGGYFMVGSELVGVSVDADKRHLPGTVQKLTKQQLIDRITATQKNMDGSSIDSDKANAIVDALLSRNGMSDYQ